VFTKTKIQESSGTMTLKGDDEYAVAAMLKFMYTSDYDSNGRAESSSSPMVFNVEVYQIADKYLVPALKSLAERNCQETFGACWDADDFPDAIAQIYSLPDTSDQGLRAMVVEVVREHSKQLITKPKFCDILKETTEFASDLATCMITESERDLVKNRCTRCTQTFKATPPKRESYYCIYCGGDLARW
jgi:speckle-type POZ protein